MAQAASVAESQPSSPARWRTPAFVALLVVGCLLALLSIVTLWAHATVLNTDQFVKTTSSVIAKPSVQEAIANRVTQGLEARIDPEARIREVLPDRAGFLAPTLVTTLEKFVHDAVLNVVSSPGFASTWERLMRAVHPQVVSLLRGEDIGNAEAKNGTITLDLGPVAAGALQRLQARGITIFNNVQPGDTPSQVVLFQSADLAHAQKVVSLADRLVVVLPILTVVCLVLALIIARPLRTGILWAGTGLAVTGFLLLVLIAILRHFYLGRLGADVSQQAAADVFDTVVRSLRNLSVLLLGVGLVVIVGALVPLLFKQDWWPWKRQAEVGTPSTSVSS